MEWVNAKKKTPDRPGRIVTMIGNKLFFGESRNSISCRYYDPDGIDYQYETICESSEESSYIFKTKITSGRWIKPSHYNDVDYWCYLPDFR